MTKNEHNQARKWREARGLSINELADLTGYSPEAIRWFEKGKTPPNRNVKGGNAADRTIKPWVWLRYKMCCAGVHHTIYAEGTPVRYAFKWGN